MKIDYGKGSYRRLEGGKVTSYDGLLILDSVKICIDGEPDSFIPLDKIEQVDKSKDTLQMKIVPSYPLAYQVLLQGQGIVKLLDDLLVLKSFKKLRWKNRWRASWS